MTFLPNGDRRVASSIRSDVIERVKPLRGRRSKVRDKVTMIKAMVQQQEIENVSIAVSLDTKRRAAKSLSGGRRS